MAYKRPTFFHHRVPQEGADGKAWFKLLLPFLDLEKGVSLGKGAVVGGDRRRMARAAWGGEGCAPRAAAARAAAGRRGARRASPRAQLTLHQTVGSPHTGNKSNNALQIKQRLPQETKLVGVPTLGKGKGWGKGKGSYEKVEVVPQVRAVRGHDRVVCGFLDAHAFVCSWPLHPRRSAAAPACVFVRPPRFWRAHKPGATRARLARPPVCGLNAAPAPTAAPRRLSASASAPSGEQASHRQPHKPAPPARVQQGPQAHSTAQTPANCVLRRLHQSCIIRLFHVFFTQPSPASPRSCAQSLR